MYTLVGRETEDTEYFWSLVDTVAPPLESADNPNYIPLSSIFFIVL